MANALPAGNTQQCEHYWIYIQKRNESECSKCGAHLHHAHLFKEPSITCPECGMVSFSAGDIREGYCGNCHRWTTRRG